MKVRKSALVLGLMATAVIVAIAGRYGLTKWVHSRAASQLDTNPEQALLTLDRWGSFIGDSSKTHWLRTEATRCVGGHERVKSLAERGVREGLDPNIVNQPLWLAMASSGLTAEAEANLAPLLVAYQDRPHEVYGAILRGHLASSKLGEGGRLLRLWESDDPTSPYYQYWRGVYAAASYDLASAIDWFSKAVETRPEFAEARTELAHIYLERADLQNALTHFQRACEVTEPSERALIGLANTLSQLGQFVESKQVLDRLERTDQESSELIHLRAKTADDAGDTEEALQLVQELMTRWPNVYRYVELAAGLNVKSGNSDQADSLYQRLESRTEKTEGLEKSNTLLREDPSNQALRLEVARDLMYFVDPNAGFGHLQAIRLSNPRNLECHRLLADYYRREGKTKALTTELKFLEELQAQAASDVESTPTEDR